MKHIRTILWLLLIALALITIVFGDDIKRGRRVTLMVQADGSEPMTFTWYKDGIPIDKPPYPQLVFESFSDSDTGEYHVKATNPFGSAESDKIVLTASDKDEYPKVPREIKIELKRKEENP